LNVDALSAFTVVPFVPCHDGTARTIRGDRWPAPVSGNHAIELELEEDAVGWPGSVYGTARQHVLNGDSARIAATVFPDDEGPAGSVGGRGNARLVALGLGSGEAAQGPAGRGPGRIQRAVRLQVMSADLHVAGAISRVEPGNDGAADSV